MKESELQKSIISLAHFKGFRVAHFERAQVRPGVWVTPVKADAKGWPDLIIVGHGRMIIAELKTNKGQLSVEQKVWIALLESVPGIEVYVFTPKDWPDKVNEILSKPDGR